MRTNSTIRLAAIAAALTLAACGGDDNNGKTGTNNGTTNNGVTNNGVTNNGTTNNGTTNNGVTNNGTTNNGTTNNGTTNNATNNGTTNNGTTNNGTTNLCLDVDCAAPADGCVDDVAVTYSGPGTCDELDGMCDYTTVMNETDCAAIGQICENAACVAIDPTPVEGKLVISEIMYNPSAVNDSAGEWFEIHNTANHVLDLQGLKFQDAATGGNLLELPTGTPIELAAGAYYVIGVNNDMTTNGGVTVDQVLTGMSLAQGGDTISILDAADNVIDQVEYDRDLGWPDPNGATLQLGSEFDPATDDNADMQFWCMGRTAYGDGDLGTPGAANESCAPVDVTIYAIQDATDANHPGVGRNVNVAGVVVTATDKVDYMFVQEQNGGEYSGLYIDVGAVDVSAINVGDVVDISGAYSEFNGLSGVALSAITDTGADITPTAELMEVSAILADSEPWEGVLLQVVEVGVTDAGFGFGEIEVDGGLIIDNLFYADFGANAADCQIYASITGPLNFSFGNFKIAPRDATDVGASTTATAIGAVTALNNAFAPADVCVAAGASVSWTNSDLILHTVTSRLPTDTNDATNIPATPVLELTLAPAATESFTFTDAGTYHYRCRPHPAMQGRVVVTSP